MEINAEDSLMAFSNVDLYPVVGVPDSAVLDLFVSISRILSLLFWHF